MTYNSQNKIEDKYKFFIKNLDKRENICKTESINVSNETVREKKVMELSKSETDIIMHTKLFHGTSELLMTKMASAPDCEIKHYSCGDCIYSPNEFRRSLGIVVEGSARVSIHNADGRKIIMNTLHQGQMLGAAALFNSNDSYIYEIRALENTKIVFFPQRIILRGLERESRFAENYIRYLSDRVLFLNRKISILTAGSAELRLANFFSDNLSDAYFMDLPLPMNELASQLSISRASLYRALDALLEAGAVSKRDREYKIEDMAVLHEYAKL